MSRIIVFDKNGASQGEIHANCTRGWAINAGGESKVKLGSDQIKSYLELGKLVVVEHPSLPAWVGVIDTPWTTIIPVEMAIYQAGYLLSLRTPDAPAEMKGTAGKIACQLIAAANAQEDLLIRPGEIDMDDPDRIEEFDQRNYWELLTDLAKRANMEFQFRPERDERNRMIIYFDMKKALGGQTKLYLQDGPTGSMQVKSAVIESRIWNRVTGVGDQSSETSRLQAGPLVDVESIKQYRLRSKVSQFSGVTVKTTLEQNTQNDLDTSSNPKIKLQVNVKDDSASFGHIRLGNTVMVHASSLCLPGGIFGWSGYGRIEAFEYNEESNTVGMNLEADL
jgi:hypothetical protein